MTRQLQMFFYNVSSFEVYTIVKWFTDINLFISYSGGMFLNQFFAKAEIKTYDQVWIVSLQLQPLDGGSFPCNSEFLGLFGF